MTGLCCLICSSSIKYRCFMGEYYLLFFPAIDIFTSWVEFDLCEGRGETGTTLRAKKKDFHFRLMLSGSLQLEEMTWF